MLAFIQRHFVLAAGSLWLPLARTTARKSFQPDQFRRG